MKLYSEWYAIRRAWVPEKAFLKKLLENKRLKNSCRIPSLDAETWGNALVYPTQGLRFPTFRSVETDKVLAKAERSPSAGITLAETTRTRDLDT